MGVFTSERQEAFLFKRSTSHLPVELPRLFKPEKTKKQKRKKQIHVQEQTIKNKNKKEKHNLSDPSSSVDKKRRRNMACSLYDHAPAQEQEFYNFGRLFLGYHCYTLRLSDLFLSEEKILKEIMHFYYMTYLATP